jgi:hypothetical protein
MVAVALFLSGAACAQQPMMYVPDDPSTQSSDKAQPLVR